MSMLGPYASYNKDLGMPSWDPNTEYVGIFERHNWNPKGVIHVGMWDFVEHECYTKLFGTYVIGIESNPETYALMSKPVADRCGFKSFNLAAFNMDNAVVRLSKRGGESSLFGRADDAWDVPTLKLDTLIEREQIDMSQYNFLNIDAEGAELFILQGIEKNLQHIDYIDLEASYGPRNGADVTLQILTEYLTVRGFKEVERSDSFASLGWGDVLFERIV